MLDLYGDDNEFAVPTEPAREEPAKAEEHLSHSGATPAPAPAAAQAPSRSLSPPPKQVSTPIEPPKPSIPNGNAPQPIQTSYSTTHDYSQRSGEPYVGTGVRSEVQDVGTPLSIVDRHVRPSEMKDEG